MTTQIIGAPKITPAMLSAGKTYIENAIMEMLCVNDIDGYLATRLDITCVADIPGSDIQTAALSYSGGRFAIWCVYDWFKNLTDDERVAVLKHEIGHFINSHHARRNGRDHYLFNIATDMSINQYIQHLPKNCVKLLPGLRANESAEYYYSELEKMQKQQAKGRGTGKGTGTGKGKSGASGKDDSSSGSGGGNGNLPDQWDTVLDADESSGEDSSSMAGDIIRDVIKQQLNAGMSPDQLRGLHAGALESYIEELTKPPIVNWKHVLSRFAATLAQAQPAMTLKRPDRRGMSPFGKKKEYLPSLAVCVDTSGSVSDELLAEFFSQIRFLGRMLSEVQVVIADAQVHEAFEYRPGLETTLRKAAKGRGGTDFDPAVNYINKELRQCDGAVYLTDGWCPVPHTKCKIPMIWIVSDNASFEGRPKVMIEKSKLKSR